jgi:hypothetical protein
MEKENQIHKKKSNEKITLMEKVSPKSHLIIDKRNLECIICFDFSINILETSCCGVLICIFCSSKIIDKKCFICKKQNYFIESKSLKRLINNSISVCPFCKEELILDEIPIHVKENHIDKFEEILLLKNSNSSLKNKFLLKAENELEFEDEENANKNDNLIHDNYFENENEKYLEFIKICFSLFKFDIVKKAHIHEHPLEIKLIKNNTNFICFFGDKFKIQNCIQRKKEEEIKEEEHKENNLTEINNNNEDKELKINNNNNNENKNENNNENNNENKNKKDNNTTIEKFFEKIIYYSCDICKYDYCLECFKIKEISFKSKIHKHNLSLSSRKTIWSCDGSKNELKCQTNHNSIRYFQGDSPCVRYRCDICDFDLCEKCLYFYKEDEEDTKIKNDEIPKNNFNENNVNQLSEAENQIINLENLAYLGIDDEFEYLDDNYEENQEEIYSDEIENENDLLD